MRDNPRSVLLVEDEPDARTILARRLRSSGWTCLPHSSVESALQDPELHRVQAVVSDIVLGDTRTKSGIDLIPALRSAGVRAPVVLMTAYADAPRLKAAMNAGASYFLEKPFGADVLRHVLDKVSAVDLELERLVNQTLTKARLSRKEEQVARAALKGLSTADIGALLGNAEKAIKGHLAQVYAKVGVAGRAEFFHLIFPT